MDPSYTKLVCLQKSHSLYSFPGFINSRLSWSECLSHFHMDSHLSYSRVCFFDSRNEVYKSPGSILIFTIQQFLTAVRMASVKKGSTFV